MKELYSYLSNIDSNLYAILIIAGCFILEQVFSSPHKFVGRGKHLLNNMIFYILTAIVSYIVAKGQVWSVKQLNDHRIGLFYLIQVPYLVKLIAGVALLDMVTYWIHRLSHNSTILWSLHRVHHSDSHMDSSSFFRFHPLELSFAIGNVIGVAIFGLDITILITYFLVVVIFIVIEHANIETPRWLDLTIGLIFTTPNMHKIHHHKEQEFTDSNYADIFILWDRLFGTFKYKPVKELQYGLAEFDDPQKQKFDFLLKSPFIKIEKL